VHEDVPNINCVICLLFLHDEFKSPITQLALTAGVSILTLGLMNLKQARDNQEYMDNLETLIQSRTWD